MTLALGEEAWYIAKWKKFSKHPVKSSQNIKRHTIYTWCWHSNILHFLYVTENINWSSESNIKSFWISSNLLVKIKLNRDFQVQFEKHMMMQHRRVRILPNNSADYPSQRSGKRALFLTKKKICVSTMDFDWAKCICSIFNHSSYRNAILQCTL